MRSQNLSQHEARPPLEGSPLCGVVLCGGRSQRMGTDKALLSFGGKTLLEHVIGRVREGIGGGPIVVVASPLQELPPFLGEGVEILRDEEAFAGPVAGLARAFGLLGESGGDKWAFVTGCDAPELVTGLIRNLGSRRPREADVVLPLVDGYEQPLMACYHIGKCIDLLKEMYIRDSSLRAFTSKLAVKTIPEVEVRKWDPQLQSFWNCHRPKDWERWVAMQTALRSGGSPADESASQS